MHLQRSPRAVTSKATGRVPRRLQNSCRLCPPGICLPGSLCRRPLLRSLSEHQRSSFSPKTVSQCRASSAPGAAVAQTCSCCHPARASVVTQGRSIPVRSKPVDAGTAGIAGGGGGGCGPLSPRCAVTIRPPRGERVAALTAAAWSPPVIPHLFPTPERVPGCARRLGSGLEAAGGRRRPPTITGAVRGSSSWVMLPGGSAGACLFARTRWKSCLLAPLLHGWRVGHTVLPSASSVACVRGPGTLLLMPPSPSS